MLLRAVIVGVGAVLLGAPVSYAGSRESPALMFSALAGPVLGAAAACPTISDERLDGVTNAVLGAIERLSRDQRDLAVANERLQQGIAAGGNGDCAETSAVLGAIERQLPPRTVGAIPHEKRGQAIGT